jgi:hypothetical protein
VVVVVDNVGAHQPDRIGELIVAAGCELVFLPAYSPDLSPIEETFSKDQGAGQGGRRAHPGGAERRDRRRPGRGHRSRFLPVMASPDWPPGAPRRLDR